MSSPFLPQNHEHWVWKFLQSFAKFNKGRHVPSVGVSWLPHMPLGTPLTSLSRGIGEATISAGGPSSRSVGETVFLCGLMVRAKPQYPPPSRQDTALPKIQPQFPRREQKENGAPSWTGCSPQQRADLPVSLHTSYRTCMCRGLWRQRDVWGWACYLISHWLIFHLKWGQR